MATFKTEDAQDLNVQTSFASKPVSNRKANAVQNLGNLLNVALDQRKRSKGQELSEDLRQFDEKTAKVVSTVQQAMELSGNGKDTFDPNTGDINVVSFPNAPQDFIDSLADVQKNASSEFKQIASAAAQGAIPKNAAAVLLESKLREQTARYPAFAPELRQTMRDLAGYDPTGYHLNQILDITAKEPHGPLTYEQKMVQRATALHHALGQESPGVQTIMYNIAKEEVSTLKDQQEMLNAKGNSRAVQALIKRSVAEAGPRFGEFYTHQKMMIDANGGIVNPELQKAAVMKARATQEAYYINLATQGGDFSKETADMITQEMDRIYKPMLEFVDNADYGKILARQNKTIAELDQRIGRSLFPELMMLKNAMSPEFASKVLDHMMAFSDPATLQKYAENYPVLKNLINAFGGDSRKLTEKLTSVYTKIASGQEIGPEDLNVVEAIEPLLVSPQTPEPVKKQYYEKYGSRASRGVGWLAQSGRRNEADKVDQEFMKRQWDMNMPQLAKKVATELVDKPYLSVKVEDDGRIKLYSTRGGQNPRPQYNAELEQLQYYVRAGKNGWNDVFGSSNVIKDITDKISSEAQSLDKGEQK